jgi:hypothetical protein
VTLCAQDQDAFGVKAIVACIRVATEVTQLACGNQEWPREPLGTGPSDIKLSSFSPFSAL